MKKIEFTEMLLGRRLLKHEKELLKLDKPCYVNTTRNNTRVYANKLFLNYCKAINEGVVEGY